MKSNQNNFAFIDSQNLNLGVRGLGWNLDWKKFRIYLKEKYLINKAYMFLGYMPENKKMYEFLKEAGYVIIYKLVRLATCRLLMIFGNCWNIKNLPLKADLSRGVYLRTNP